MEKNIRLGKGLSTLMGDDLPALNAAVESAEKKFDSIVTVLLDLLVPSPFQPRRLFDEAALDDLVESIREKGVLQPLLVRPNPKQPNGEE